MDTSDEEIKFNSDGVCNHCVSFSKRDKRTLKDKSVAFQELIQEIKSSKPKSATYHCLAAVSGGTDSSYMIHKLKQEGLKVLAVHVDAGWNAEEADVNLKSIIEKTGVDYYTIRLTGKPSKRFNFLTYGQVLLISSYLQITCSLERYMMRQANTT